MLAWNPEIDLALIISALTLMIALFVFYLQNLKPGSIWISPVRNAEIALTGPENLQPNMVVALGLTFHNSGARTRTIEDLNLILTYEGAVLPKFRAQFISERIPVPKDPAIVGALTIPSYSSQSWVIGFVCDQPGIVCISERYEAAVEITANGKRKLALRFCMPKFGIDDLKGRTKWIGIENFERVR